MGQAEKVWVEPDRTVKFVPRRNLIGLSKHDQILSVQEDVSSLGIKKIDPFKEVGIVEISKYLSPGSSVAEVVRAIKKNLLNAIPLDAGFLPFFMTDRHLMHHLIKLVREEDEKNGCKDGHKQVYFFLAGTLLTIGGSVEKFRMPMFWNAKWDTRGGYASRLGKEMETRTFVLLYQGNYFAAKDPNRTW